MYISTRLIFRAIFALFFLKALFYIDLNDFGDHFLFGTPISLEFEIAFIF